MIGKITARTGLSARGALSPDAVLTVVHTERGDKIRLISARKANRRERTVYYDHLA
jgi:uncharacterized DUF497 family protein